MIDLPRLLEKSERLQWSVDDVDWDAAGADRVDDAQAAALAPFMGDLYWIESTAAVVFAAMAERDDDPVRKGLFRSFAIDEARHAEAERRLMVRWGIVGRRQRPEPNANVRHLFETLQVNATKVHPSVFSAIIPMTELVLDGALVKYLVRVVDDPVCHRVFEGINADEARHLAMDFHMLEHYGREQSRFANTMDLVRSRASLEKIGLDMEEAARAMGRYVELGRKNPDIAKHPTYRILSSYVEGVTSGRSRIGDVLVRVSDVVDGLSSAGRAA
jgi:hypothetical protein